MLHDGEPEAGAARGARAVAPVEALEEPREILGRDADAVVGCDELDPTVDVALARA